MHRVQRVPVTETQGRVHTSTVTVAVLPEAETVDVEILDKDIKIDTYRSSGAGGQHINKTDSAIRITHFPTGIVVTCQDQRSQTKNKERAMQVLATKLYDFYQGQKDEEYASLRKGQVGTGDRSERIRTYNFPQGRVTDHRIGFTLYSIDEFMNGDLDKMVEALRIADQTRRRSTNSAKCRISSKACNTLYKTRVVQMQATRVFVCSRVYGRFMRRLHEQYCRAHHNPNYAPNHQ